MSKIPYTPRPGSMPSKLLQHLRLHPSADFTTAGVAKQFGSAPTAVQTALAPAVAAQLLSRTATGQPRGQMRYSAGPKLGSLDLTPKPKAASTPKPPQADPAPTTDALRHYGDYCARSDTVTLNAAQREHLCLVIGAHVLAANAQLAAAEATPS